MLFVFSAKIAAISEVPRLGDGGGMKPASRNKPINHVIALTGPAHAQMR
jgi:hypothetical protein